MLETAELQMSEQGSRNTSLAGMRELHRELDTLIRSIYEKKTAWAARQTAHQAKIKCAYATVKTDYNANSAWQRLRNHLGSGSGLFSIEPVIADLGPQPGNTFLDAMLMLALRHLDWIRPLEEWQPPSSELRPQFASLVRHLLAEYAVPPFMDAAWFKGFTTHGELHRDWFMHIGIGLNIRTAQNDIALTKMAAHHFLHAPDDWSIAAALRRGQVTALGGDEFLAQAIAESKMGSILPDEEFWESVIHFFVNNTRSGTLRDPSAVGPLIDYIYARRVGEDAVLDVDGRLVAGDAPEPMFTMKGRTLTALQQRVQEWHEELARDSKKPRSSWQPTGIGDFLVQEKDSYGTENVWTIRELLNTVAMLEEGRELKHCVRTYADDCQKGKTSIWSLRVRPTHDSKTRRLLTIEVNNSRRAIVQVRGSCNKTLGSFRNNGRMMTAAAMLRRWSQEQKLSIACSLG